MAYNLVKKKKWLFIVIIILLGFAISFLSFYRYFNNITYIIQREAIDNTEDIVIAGSVGDFTGRFPDIIQADDGLIAAFYWNNTHAPYVFGDSLGIIQIVKGESDGNQWNAEPCFSIDEQFLIDNGLGVWRDDKKFYYSQDEARKNNAEFCIEVRDPNFAIMDNKIILTFFTRLPWDSHLGGHIYYRYNEKYDYTYGRTYIMYSEDDGKTWSSPVEIECDYLDRGCAKRGNIATIGKNTILIPLYGYNHNMKNTFTTANIVATLKDGRWEFQKEFNAHQEEGNSVGGAFEAGVTEVSFTTVGKYVYALCRPNGDILVSIDSGRTWDKIQSSGGNDLNLHQPSLYTIKKSHQILASWSEPNEIGGRDVYLYLFKPNRDNVWRYDLKYCIYKNKNAGDMADPTSILLTDNSILTIYYDAQKGIVACTKTKMEDEKYEDNKTVSDR